MLIKSMNNASLNRLLISWKSLIMFIFLIIITESVINPLNVDIENLSEIEHVLESDNMDENEKGALISKIAFDYVTTLFPPTGQVLPSDKMNFSAIEVLTITIDAPPPESQA